MGRTIVGSRLFSTRTHAFGAGVLSLLFVWLIAGCAAQSPVPSDAATAIRELPAASHNDAVVMTVWSVPAAVHAVKLQVQLVPRVYIATGRLEAKARDLALSPDRFELERLRPPSSRPQPFSPPTPPALGRAYDYTFNVTARRAGTYPIDLYLELPNKQNISMTVSVLVP